MSKKRSAAAEIFRQQNMVTEEESEAVLADVDEVSNMMPTAPPVAPAYEPPRSANKPQQQAKKASYNPIDSFVTSEELQIERGGVQVRETGFLWWKRVIVPPNAYVVHTRTGQGQPVTLGLGVSFRYNPRTDAYLVVPAAMQTIGVISNCISQEKQGINVLAYVQWQISDFSIAYRKLDFSDPQDPLGVVNAQLREQADAAIKDKIATMSVDEVLTDKAPVIEELTRRLIEVAEGRFQSGSSDDEDGLGIKIVTVQIKEAIVSSQRLWEHLQAPFRHEQERLARISHLSMQQDIQQRELEAFQFKETSEAETRVSIAQVQQVKETEEITLRAEEERKRNERAEADKIAKAQAEAETRVRLNELEIAQQIQQAEDSRRLAEERAKLEAARLQHEAEIQQAQNVYDRALEQLKNALLQDQVEAELQRKETRHLKEMEIDGRIHDAEHQQAQQAVTIARLEQEVRNLTNDQALLQAWIEQLPELVEGMPEIEHMQVLHMGDNADDRMSTFIAQQFALFRSLRDFLANGDQSNNGASEAS